MNGVAETVTLAEFGRIAASGGLTPPVLPLSQAVGRVLAQILVSDVKARFDVSRAPDGTPWRPLKRPRPDGSSKPLLDTGQLRASITAESDETGITVGTTRAGAALHQYGGTVTAPNGRPLEIPLTRQAKRAGRSGRLRRPGKIPPTTGSPHEPGHFLLVHRYVVPARPFLGVSDEAARQVARVLAEVALAGWNVTGG